MAETINPSAGYLLVQPSKKSKETAGGLVLPDEATKERPVTGRVVAVGADYWHDGTNNKSEFEVGDTVIYHAYAGGEYKDEFDNAWRLLPFYGDQRPIGKITKQENR
jgi:chaperonin GroES